jgi:hypothetical protein
MADDTAPPALRAALEKKLPTLDATLDTADFAELYQLETVLATDLAAPVTALPILLAVEDIQSHSPGE